MGAIDAVSVGDTVGMGSIDAVGMGTICVSPTTATPGGTGPPLTPPACRIVTVIGYVIACGSAAGAIAVRPATSTPMPPARQDFVIRGLLQHAQIPRRKPRLSTAVITFSPKVYRVPRAVNEGCEVREESAPQRARRGSRGGPSAARHGSEDTGVSRTP